MQNVEKKGLIFVNEGGDGTGKTVQNNLLLLRLQRETKGAATMSFPRYETPTGSVIRQALDGRFGNFLELPPKFASAFYGTDRHAALPEITAIIENGIHLVFNRFVPSNKAHQGAKLATREERVEFYNWVDEYEHGHLGLPRPDFIFVLHLPAEIAQRYAQERDAKLGITGDQAQNNLAHLQAAEQAYLLLAELDREQNDEANRRVFVIECMHEDGVTRLSPEEIHEKIWAIVEPRLR